MARVEPDLSETAIATTYTVDSRDFMSDPVNIEWYNRKIDVSIFINGKWTSCIPYVYTNNTWVKSKAVLCELNMIY